MKTHRHTVDISLRNGDYPVIEEFARDNSLKLLAFCTDEPESRHLLRNVAFPHQSELKINGMDLKHNLRGLKNKPGSTRPADVTTAMHLKPSTYVNKVELVYALTEKKYWLSVWVVKTVPVSDLVKELQAGYTITQASVLNESKSSSYIHMHLV